MQKKILSFTDLEAWKRGHELVLLIYEAPRAKPVVSSHSASHQSCEVDLLGKNCLAGKAIHPRINPWFSCFDDKITESFPNKEIFGLTIQIRRAAVSVTSNIAEGFGRHSYKEKIQFYFMAQGSLLELQNQIIIAKDIGYISEKDLDRVIELSTEVQKITNGLIRGGKSFI